MVDSSSTSSSTDTRGSSRRKFLAVAGVGAAGVGVAGAVPSLASTSHPQAQQAGTTRLTPLTQDLVLTVANAATGTFNILVGERSIEITDAEFASRIAKAIA